MNYLPKNDGLDTYISTLLKDNAESFLLAGEEPTAVRNNSLKVNVAYMDELLNKHGYHFKTIPFTEGGYILESDPLPLSHSLSFFEGNIQYQGISSQLPVQVLNPQPGEKVLDMTAAPGSKSSQLASLMNQQGILVLNDSSRTRLQGLQTNMQRSGALNFFITKIRGENLSRFFPGYFDKILVDAPCTALGTLANNWQVRHWWSESKLEKLSKLQYQLILSAFKCLKVGGELIYSTCSVAPEENELVIEKICQKFPLEILPIDEKINRLFDNGWTTYHGQKLSASLKNAIRIWPHKHQQEGFFVIKLKKTSTGDDSFRRAENSQKKTLTHDHQEIADILEKMSGQWGIPDSLWPDFRYVLTRERLWILSATIDQVPKENFISAGILLGEKRISGWKLTNSSAQLLSDHIKARRIRLTERQLKELFRHGNIRYPDLGYGYYALDYDGRIIASVYTDKENLMIRLPHSFHLVL